MISRQNFENKAFYMGFMHLKIKIKEKFKLKTKLAKTKIQKSVLYKLCRIFSASRRRLNFENTFTGSGDISTGARKLFHFAFKEKQKKPGKDCLVMIEIWGNYLEQ